MIIDTTQPKVEIQMTEVQKFGAFFYGTTFYPQGAEIPEHIIKEVILNGFHDFSRKPRSID